MALVTKGGYYVFRFGNRGKKPRVLHATIGEAMIEAQRLAKADPNGRYLILQLVGGIQSKNGQFEYINPMEQNKE